MSNAYATPLHLRLPRDSAFYRLIGWVHAGIIAGLALLPVPAWARVGAMAAVAAAWLFTHRRLNGPGRILEATWEEGGQWSLRLADGAVVAARLAADSYFHPRLIVLHFHGPHRHLPALVLLGHEPDRDTHRRLRVRLRLHRAEREGGSEPALSALNSLAG